ncbi:MAG: hypothetical protein V7724_05775 [Sediminicola sp.]
MKTTKRFLALVSIVLLSLPATYAQYGYGNGGYGNNGYGRRQSSIPQAQQAPEKEEPLTAEEMVEGQMPAISEALGLNDFEKAVVATTLTKYLKQRMELQILQLDADQTRSALEKISLNQEADLKAGLPADKYEAFVELQKEGLAKAKRKIKKKKKKSN